MLEIKRLPRELLDLTRKLMQDEKLQDFRLVGGAALALQIGILTSTDLELIHNGAFDINALKKHFSRRYEMQESAYRENCIAFRAGAFTVNLIPLEVPWSNPPVVIDGIRMASLGDLSALNLNDIYAGIRQIDFIHTYYLLEHMPLNKMPDAFSEKYFKDLVEYVKQGIKNFEYIENKSEIKPFDQAANWDKVKTRLREAVANPDKIFKPELLSLMPKKNTSQEKGLRI